MYRSLGAVSEELRKKKSFFLNWDVLPVVKERLDSVMSIMVAHHAGALKKKTCR